MSRLLKTYLSLLLLLIVISSPLPRQQKQDETTTLEVYVRPLKRSSVSQGYFCKIYTVKPCFFTYISIPSLDYTDNYLST